VSEGEVHEPSNEKKDSMARIEQYHNTEQGASTGYWMLVFSGVIDNAKNSMEESVKSTDDGGWKITASF